MTGLGTPVANLLVSDLVAYQGPGTSYAGPKVGPLQDATLSGGESGNGSAQSVINVFDSLTLTGASLGRSAFDAQITAFAAPQGQTAAPGETGRAVGSNATVLIFAPFADQTTNQSVACLLAQAAPSPGSVPHGSNGIESASGQTELNGCREAGRFRLTTTMRGSQSPGQVAAEAHSIPF